MYGMDLIGMIFSCTRIILFSVGARPFPGWHAGGGKRRTPSHVHQDGSYEVGLLATDGT